MVLNLLTVHFNTTRQDFKRTVAHIVLVCVEMCASTKVACKNTGVHDWCHCSNTIIKSILIDKVG